MVFRSFCFIAAILPLAIFGSALSADPNGISAEFESKKPLVRNGVKVGDKELTSAEALDLLSSLANNATENKEGGVLPPPQGGIGGEFGPLIPESGPELPENKIPELPTDGNTSNILIPNKISTDNPNPSGRMRCQDEGTKKFIPTARACSDVRGPEVCESLFSAPDETTGRRDPKCDQPGYEDIAKSCRKQCAICCEDMNFSCEDDDSGLIDCQKNKDKCGVTKWFDVLSKYCAGTCGLCIKTSCRDTNSDCRTMKAVCKNPEHKLTMESQCARTCGFCIPGVTSNPIVSQPAPPAPAPSPVNPPSKGPSGGQNCVDVGKNCAERANLCGHPLYMEYMNKLCPKTCGTCGAHVPLQTVCADTHPRCQQWVDTGFCTNQYYTKEYKKKNCGKSCKLC